MYLLERYVPTNERFFYNCTDDEGNKYIKVTLDQCPHGLDWVVTTMGQEGMEIQKWYVGYIEARAIFSDICSEETLSIGRIKTVFGE